MGTATCGQFDFQVQVVDIRGNTSNILNGSFYVADKIPAITWVNPAVMAKGGSGCTLAVMGSGFSQQGVVQWNGQPRSTTWVSDARLQAMIPSSDLASAGLALVTVANPMAEGGTSRSTTSPGTPSTSCSMPPFPTFRTVAGTQSPPWILPPAKRSKWCR